MPLPKEFQELFFPHEEVRPVQDQLIKKVDEAVSSQQNLIVHAPTGLGKTAAALGPGLKQALKNDLTVFFLTSRHTQHKLAIETINQIKQSYGLDFSAADIIGKKWLCNQPNAAKLYSREFQEYCKKMREDELCEYFNNTRKKGEPSAKAVQVMRQLKKADKTDTESVIEKCREEKLCPYELGLMIARDAKVIIGDYYYLFNPHIRDTFLKKTGKELSKIIIVIDEGHNLPSRIKDLSSHRISTNTLKRARDEAGELQREDLDQAVMLVQDWLRDQGRDVEDEEYIKKEQLLVMLKQGFDYDELVGEMSLAADTIREEQRHSSLGTLAAFLEAWKKDQEGFTRIISKATDNKGERINIAHYRCLDPGLISRDIIRGAYATILMSGTLTPTRMYKEVLGFDSAEEAVFSSPFPKKNRLNIIIPKTSTKYTSRSESQYREIAEIIARATNVIPGNSAVFFPSYHLRDEVNNFFSRLTDKPVFVEKSKFTKKEKLEFLESFKGYKNVGAVLMGVTGGNFAEGIDLPGDFLKGVIIVGLPLQRPDLETQALIKYYDKKFGKGWDYGYLFPAFNRALQSAGRCIRSEKDKGVVIFLDERYTWKNYSRCFPPGWDIKTTLLYESMIKGFFREN